MAEGFIFGLSKQKKEDRPFRKEDGWEELL